jgi:hypothetical protein
MALNDAGRQVVWPSPDAGFWMLDRKTKVDPVLSFIQYPVSSIQYLVKSSNQM